MGESTVSVSRRVFSGCTRCGLCLLAPGGEAVTRFETKLSRPGRKPIKMQVCGSDGGSMTRLAKELTFYSALPRYMDWVKTDGTWGRWLHVDMAIASVPLGKRLRKFFSNEEQAQLAAAGSAEMVDLPWVTEAIQ